MWADGLFYKLNFRKFPSYLVRNISSSLCGQTFEASFETTTTTLNCIRAGVVKGEKISLVLFGLYVKDIPSPSRHVELAPYADDTVVIAASRQPALLVRYVKSYLSDLQRWQRERTMAIKVSHNTKMLSAKAGRRIHVPRSVQLIGEPIHRVDTAR